MEKKPASSCIIDAPCKVNLHLAVGEKRPDGYHNLESIFVSLALADTLRFVRTTREGGCDLHMHWAIPMGQRREKAIPIEKNLIYRSLCLFREYTGRKEGMEIHVEKRIPPGAGLGGGSSNAASTLMALNLLFGAELGADTLGEMAAALGSDVPFFLTGGAAYVSGRGELIEPVRTPRGLWVVLVKPPFPSGTAEAYRRIDQARENKGKREEISRGSLIRALEVPPGNWPFYNDFLSVLPESAAYTEILEKLRNLGASFTGLSGSGSCCYGIFTAKEAAEMAEKEVRNKENFTGMSFFLAQKANGVLEY